MSATSASQRTESSCAFLSSPARLFENVTCRLILFSIRFSWTLPLPIDFRRRPRNPNPSSDERRRRKKEKKKRKRRCRLRGARGGVWKWR
ncbi:hypothetical protein KSP40_PGU016679 [Platanthera guangdongensis]|uniref:Uncharacterized protein n=1 Tax=Platanthera guangdongensis TaxID=2320717 RepID=A0ABR2ME36_9ASPA